MATFEGRFTDASGLRIAVVVARFNDLVTAKLLSGCLDCMARHGVAAPRGGGGGEWSGGIHVWARSGAILAFFLPPNLRKLAVGTQKHKNNGIL